MNLKAIAVVILHVLCAIWLALALPDNIDVEPVPSLPVGDEMTIADNIIDLAKGWNIVSMPEVISKDAVYIRYNNNTYTWAQATQIPLVADYLKGYDGTSYFEADTFLPYRGYWIYSFVEPACIIESDSVIICKQLSFDSNSTLNLVCDKLIITEFSNQSIICNTMNPGIVEFEYAGIPMP